MRLFIYVNENSHTKHITIHCEQKEPCPHLMQQIISGNTQDEVCEITDISGGEKKVLKLRKSQNTYWLLLHIPNNECNNLNLNQIRETPEIKNILNSIKDIPIQFCNICCNT